MNFGSLIGISVFTLASVLMSWGILSNQWVRKYQAWFSSQEIQETNAEVKRCDIFITFMSSDKGAKHTYSYYPKVTVTYNVNKKQYHATFNSSHLKKLLPPEKHNLIERGGSLLAYELIKNVAPGHPITLHSQSIDLNRPDKISTLVMHLAKLIKEDLASLNKIKNAQVVPLKIRYVPSRPEVTHVDVPQEANLLLLSLVCLPFVFLFGGIAIQFSTWSKPATYGLLFGIIISTFVFSSFFQSGILFAIDLQDSLFPIGSMTITAETDLNH